LEVGANGVQALTNQSVVLHYQILNQAVTLYIPPITLGSSYTGGSLCRLPPRLRPGNKQSLRIISLGTYHNTAATPTFLVARIAMPGDNNDGNINLSVGAAETAFTAHATNNVWFGGSITYWVPIHYK
jgi:hypothetical protein